MSPLAGVREESPWLQLRTVEKHLLRPTAVLGVFGGAGQSVA